MIDGAALVIAQHIDFASQNRLNPFRLAGLVVPDCPEHVGAISDRNGRHRKFFDPPWQLGKSHRARQKRELGMYMQVDKFERHPKVLTSYPFQKPCTANYLTVYLTELKGSWYWGQRCGVS